MVENKYFLKELIFYYVVNI